MWGSGKVPSIRLDKTALHMILVGGLTKTQSIMSTEQEQPKTQEDKQEEQEQTEETKIDPELQNKITRFKALREQGIYFNDNLVQSKSYRNPNIYTKLVEFLSLHETSTNFEPTFWDPRGFPDSAQADSLRQLQQSLADEKEKQRSNQATHKRTNIEFEQARHQPSSSSTTHLNSKGSLKRDRERDRDREGDRERNRQSGGPTRRRDP